MTSGVPDAPLRVARWVRVSTEEQSKEGHAGLERQFVATDRIIAARGYELVASFEVVHSGATVTGTVEFAQLMDLIPRLDAVIVSEVSRLIRVDSWQSMAVLDVFTRHRCLIIADGQTIDFSSPQGFLTGGVTTVMAGAQRLELVQKISESKTALKLRGHLASGDRTLPFAVRYNWKTHKYSYDPKKIWRVQEAYRLIAEEGISNLSEVCRRIGMIKRTALRIILANPVYGYGIRRYDKQRDMSVNRIGPDGHQADRPKISLPPEQVIEVKVIKKPAVSPERFELVGQILEELRANHVATLPVEKRVHLCTTYGRCGFCGQVLYISGNGKRDKATGLPLHWYCCRSQHPGKKGKLPRCNNTWTSAKKLDALLVAFASRILTDRATLTKLVAESARISSEVIRPFPKTGGTEHMIAKLEKQDRKFIRMCSEDAITISQLKQERAAIREEIARLRSIAVDSRPQPQAMAMKDFSRLLVRGAARFTRVDHREQKAMLEQMFAEVFFRGESVTAVRLHPNLVASLGTSCRELGQTINLETPFRITPEVPAGHKQCSKCDVILSKRDFPEGRSRCKPCFRVDQQERRARAAIAAAGKNKPPK